MQDSNVPAKFQIPFANGAGGGYIRTVPQASQIGVQNGAASLTDGFPPNCFVPIASGGSWPYGQDFNGILNLITKWNQWQQAGGPIYYDSTFSTSIGGYPKGALLLAAAGTFYWVSTADNNTSNPDAGGANWFALSTGMNVAVFSSVGTTSFTVPAGAVSTTITGGGGAGGASDGATFSGGGGGAGGTAFKIVKGLTIGATISVTVAAGGTPGTSGVPGSGGSGGTSSFGSYASATGGSGGVAGTFTAAGGQGGSGSGGDQNVNGGQGADGNSTSSSTQGGHGGASFWGGGGRTGAGAGQSGGGPGAGGGGCWLSSGNGAAGQPGTVVVRW